MQKSVLIGMPCLDSIKVNTVSSLFEAINEIDYPAKLHLYSTSLTHDSRNKIAQEALDKGFSHLLFIDSDMVFEHDAIKRILEHDDKEIVAGLYYRRYSPHQPNITMVRGKKLYIPQTFPKKQPFTVFGVGTGFMLIKSEVFKKIKPPWFNFISFHGQQMGEDISFCHKANQRKIKVWCDPSIYLGHVGEYVYDEKDYQAYQATRPDTSEQLLEDVWSEI